MNAIESPESVPHQSRWGQRLLLAASVTLLWAGLRFLVDATVLSRGLDRPVCVLVGDGGIVAAVAVLILVAVVAAIGRLLCGRHEGAQGLLVVGLGLALWAFDGGTMDDWLKMRNTVAGAPTGTAYAPLLAEYVYWAIAMAAAYLLTGRRRSSAAANPSPERRGKSATTASAELRDGLTALAATAAIAGILMMFLTGPRVGHTYRGQVYFAVAVAFILGVLAARRITGTHSIVWYLPAPLIVGVIGVCVAVARPGLGAVYANINVIPAWGLVRPLPIEMVAVGLVAIILTLRTANRLSSEEDPAR